MAYHALGECRSNNTFGYLLVAAELLRRARRSLGTDGGYGDLRAVGRPEDPGLGLSIPVRQVRGHGIDRVRATNVPLRNNCNAYGFCPRAIRPALRRKV